MANEVYAAIKAGEAIWERGELITMTLTLRQVEMVLEVGVGGP